MSWYLNSSLAELDESFLHLGRDRHRQATSIYYIDYHCHAGYPDALMPTGFLWTSDERSQIVQIYSLWVVCLSMNCEIGRLLSFCGGSSVWVARVTCLKLNSKVASVLAVQLNRRHYLTRTRISTQVMRFGVVSFQMRDFVE